MVYKGVDRVMPRDGTRNNEGLNRRYKRKWNAAMNESANWKTLFFSVLSRFCCGNAYSFARSRSIHTSQRCACSVRVQKCVFFYFLHFFLVTLGIYKHSARQLEVYFFFFFINLTICFESCRRKLRRFFKLDTLSEYRRIKRCGSASSKMRCLFGRRDV